MILDADAEALVIAHLAAELPARGIGATVSDRVPTDADRNAEHVRVLRTGGARRDLVTDQAQLTVDVRAGSSARAAHVLNVVRGLLEDMWGHVIGGSQIYDVGEFTGPYSNPAPTDPYRYTMTFLVAVRAGQIA